MKALNYIKFVLILFVLIFWNSCYVVEVEYDCGEVETEITEWSNRVGTYIDSSFTDNSSTNFEEAAIQILIEEINIITETETSCFAYTALAQRIEKIDITSPNSLLSGGIEFAADELLNGLFKVHNNEQTSSISEFISAQNNDPLIFHGLSDELILQLMEVPDMPINQSFEIQITFDDSKIMNVEIPNFEVTN